MACRAAKRVKLHMADNFLNLFPGEVIRCREGISKEGGLDSKFVG